MALLSRNKLGRIVGQKKYQEKAEILGDKGERLKAKGTG